MSWTRRLAVSTGLAVAAVGIAVPLSLSTSPAAATAADPMDSVSAFTSSDAPAKGDRMPAQLKADLKAAWAAPDGQRVAALGAVLDKAVAGDYGAKVEQRAKRLKQRLAAMDPTLRSDLQKAIELPQDQRRAALKQIRQKIRAGDYGDQAKRDARFLKRLRHHRLAG